MISLILLTIASALAAPPALSLLVETGSMGTRGDNWEALTDAPQLASVGGRVGLDLTEQFALVADYQFSRYGSGVEVYDPEGQYEYEDLSLDIRLRAHQLTLGPKVMVPVTSWLRPYGTVQAVGVLGALRLDEEPRDEDEGLRRFTDLAPGGLAALGVDVADKDADAPVRVAAHFEAGYALLAPFRFADEDASPAPVDLGELGLGGLYLRLGIGVRL